MNKFAIIFPGQGAQKAGMGKDLYENSVAARKVFETADRILGRSITDLCFNATDEELMQTINSQPCILTVELAAYEALKEQYPDIEFVCTAGHSLGEYAALYAAGMVDLETVLQLIQERAKLMDEAAQKTSGSMAAIIGLDDETVKNLTSEIEDVYVANYNSTGQVVITGEKEAINNCLDKFKEAGAKRALPLSVSGAFHSPLMNIASEKFIDFINKFEFNDTNIDIYTNVDANPERNGNICRDKLPKQICSSVLWTQTIKNITDAGIMNFIEIGPGKVLAGLNKKINSEIKTLNIYDLESLNTVITELEAEKELV